MQKNTYRDVIKRNHTKEQDRLIRDVKLKYLLSETKQEQDFWAKIIGKISFF